MTSLTWAYSRFRPTLLSITSLSYAMSQKLQKEKAQTVIFYKSISKHKLKWTKLHSYCWQCQFNCAGRWTSLLVFAIWICLNDLKRLRKPETHSIKIPSYMAICHQVYHLLQLCLHTKQHYIASLSCVNYSHISTTSNINIFHKNRSGFDFVTKHFSDNSIVFKWFM